MMPQIGLPALEEIRVARDAVELIITMRAKHPALNWSLQACEYHEAAHVWRLAIVLHKPCGNVRQAIFAPKDSTPSKLAAEVDAFLSLF
jgi:hypothetical protein